MVKLYYTYQTAVDGEPKEDTKPARAKRLTTNKRKIGVHYYESANVKNRNRSKQKPTDKKHKQKWTMQ